MSVAESPALKTSRSIINAALRHLRTMAQADHVGSQLVPRISIEAPGRITLPSEYQPDWSIASFRTQMELEKTPSFRQFEQAIEEDPLLGARMNTMVGTSTQKRRMTCRDFFQVLLSKALRKCDDDLQLSDDRFSEAWDSVVKPLMADRVATKFWCILENVETPTASIEVLPNVFMRGLSTYEREDLWNRHRIVQDYYPFYSITGSSILDVQTLLEMTTDEIVVVGESEIDPSDAISRYGSVRASFESICTSIRLIRPERILMSPIIVEIEDVWGSTSAYGNMERMAIPYGDRCKLSEQDICEVQKLLRVVSRGESGLSRAIMVCLRRIGFANMRSSIEDRLLDTTMALEALVLSDSGNRGELSFRLAIRLAKFLGTGKEEQLKIYKTVRGAYDLRSKIVHGGKLDPKDQASFGDLENLTRAATRKYLHALAEGEVVDWHALLFD